MGAVGNYKDSLASVTLNESKELLRERLDAIMLFQKRTQKVKVFTAILTTLFFWDATMVGAYAGEISANEANDTYQVIFNHIEDGKNRPLNINIAIFPVGDSVTDTYITYKGDICSSLFSWEGNGSARLVLHPLPPMNIPDKEIPIENGVPLSFVISDTDGYYMVTVENDGEMPLKNFVGELSIITDFTGEVASDNSDENSKSIIVDTNYTQIAAYNKESDFLYSVIPIKIEYDNQELQLGFRCDNAKNYLTAFVVPANANDYFIMQDYLSLIEPYANGIYVDYPFKSNSKLDTVIMVSRGFYGSTRFGESQITVDNTDKKGEYYIYFIAEDRIDCSLSVRVIAK